MRTDAPPPQGPKYPHIPPPQGYYPPQPDYYPPQPVGYRWPAHMQHMQAYRRPPQPVDPMTNNIITGVMLLFFIGAGLVVYAPDGLWAGVGSALAVGVVFLFLLVLLVLFVAGVRRILREL